MRNQGFTLLELLVVLVITTLTTMLLFQGLSFVMQLREQLLNQFDEAHRGQIQEHWFRSSTESLVPAYEDIPNAPIFKGEATKFSGLTISALDADHGVPVEFDWELTTDNDNVTLVYHDSQKQAWQVLNWQGELGKFSYLANDGQWHDQWPPANFGLQPPQLPRAILFMGKRHHLPITWIVSIHGRERPKLDLRQIDMY
ncbi:MAG: prepilin-type N-terminal cleavage/methylation domain-containing protein [Thiotrichaceae bacterium]